MDKANYVFEKLAKYIPCKVDFKTLRKYRKTLTSEERAQVMKRNATWHFTGKPSPAVWKAVLPSGKTIFVTNTHRAFNTASTVKGAINRYHVFIKGTA